MKLIFEGIQKENIDSLEFFYKLENYEVDYDVDIRTGDIIIDNIKPGIGMDIIKEIREFFEVVHIKAQRSHISKQINDKAKSTEQLSEFEKTIEELKSLLCQQKIKEETQIRYLRNVMQEIKMIGTKQKKKIDLGEIMSCDFTTGVRSENNGVLNVVVLRKTEKNKYLVIPINLLDQYSYNNECCLTVTKGIDAMYYNGTYKRPTAVLYLNRIQEVDAVRLGHLKSGKITKRFLKKIYERLPLMSGQEEMSLIEELEDLVSAAIWECKRLNSVHEKVECFLSIMSIPQENTLLKSAISIAFSTKIVTLKKIISLIKLDHRDYSEYKINTKLREEFVTWFKDEYSDIFEKYEKISLADLLKAIVKQLDEEIE